MIWSWRTWLKQMFFVNPGNRKSRRGRRNRSLPLLTVETLEGRIVPSDTVMTPYYIRIPNNPGPYVQPYNDPNTGGYEPQGILTAYGLTQLPAADTGAGETIAVVDAYDDPAFVSSTNSSFLQSDLHYFDVRYGLADPVFVKVSQTGSQTALPATDPSTGSGSDWEGEEALDVEWAHVMAPAAKIILVECNNAGTLFTGVDWAAKTVANGGGGADVVSMSFGTSGGDGPQELTEDADFSPSTYPNVTFLASSDDNGSNGYNAAHPTPQAAYPSDSPNVISVGGTSLNMNTNTGAYQSESAWSDSGGGISNFESQPSYQNPATNSFSTTKRSAPDVSFLADPQTGVDVYDSYNGNGVLASSETNADIGVVGGTSLSSPCWAGIIAISDQIRANAGLPALTGATQTLPRLYALYSSSSYSADFHDVTSGSNGTYSAGAGYDLVTGIGSPIVNNLAPALANVTSLTYTAPAGTNAFVLKVVGTNLDLYDNGSIVVFGTASLITQVTITGGTDNSLTIDYSGGAITAAVGFTGGTGSAAHTLTLQGNTTAYAPDLYVPSGPGAGTITLGTQVVTYANVTATDDVALATSITIDGTNSADQINITNGGTVNSTQTTEVASGNNTFTTLFFANKSTVNVNGLAGADTFTVNNPAPALGMSTLSVDGGAAAGVIFNVLTAPAGVTTSILAGGTAASVNVGNAGSVQGIVGILSLDNSTGAHSAIIVDDSADTTARTFTLSNGQIIGLAPGFINYVASDTQSLTVNGGSGGNHITVSSASTGLATNLNSGNGSDTITVNPLATGTNLVINGQLPAPPTLPGDILYYTASGTYVPSGVGAGTISQSGQGTVTFSNIETISVGADAGHSFVTAAPANVTSGSTVTVILHAEDASGNPQITGGLTVAFGLGAGTATGNFSAVTDNNNGTYTATFTAIGAGANTITATINGVPVTSTQPTITVTPAGLNLAHSTVTVASANDPSGAGDLITVTARDANGNQLLSGGLTVLLGLGAGTSTGTITPLTAFDNGNGTYTATFTGILVGTPRIVTATINGNNVGSTSPTITVIPGAASTANSILTVGSAIDASGIADTLTLTTFDAAGNPETSGGASVVFGLGSGASTGAVAPATDNGNGTYSATFTGILVGSARTITASIGGASLTSVLPTITVVPGAPDLSQSVVSILSPSIVSGTSTTVTLLTKDLNGNLETTGGQTVGFGLGTGASSGTFSNFADLGNGSYTETITGTTAGTPRTVTASIGGSSVTSALPTLTVTPGPVSLTQSSITVAQASLVSGNVETVTLTLRDADGNQEPNGGGLSIVFGVGSGTSTGTLSAATDMGNGTFTATFTGVLAGTPTQITATVNGSAVTTAPPTIQVTPGALSLATSTVSVVQSTIQSGNTDFVILTAEDAAGNQLASGGLTVTFGFGTGSSSGTLSGVTDHGNGSYTAIFTGILAGTPTLILGSINGSPVGSTPPSITVTPGAISLAQSTVTIVPSSIASGTTATVTFTARDAAGNPETTGGHTVLFGLGAGTSTGAFSGVTDNGNGTYTGTFTGALVGTPRTIIATIDGSTITSAPPSITVTTGVLSLANSIITVGTSTVVSGNTDLVLLTTRDAAGNIEPAGLSVAFGLGAGTSTGTLGPVTDLGNGAYDALFSGILAGTPLTITATIGGNAVTSALPAIQVVSGSVNLANSTVTVVPSTVQSGTTATITLTARDNDGNAETTGGLAVAFSLAGGTSGGTLTNFQDNGNGTYTETFTGGAVGSPRTIMATIGGTLLGSTFPTVTVTPGPVSLANSFAFLTPTTIAAGGTTTVTLMTKDAFGNFETSGGQSVALSVGGGAAGGAFSAVTDLGNGIYTATFTSNGTIGGNTVGATINGGALTSAAPSLTVVPAAFSLAKSIIAIAPGSIASGTNATVTLTARDAFGNQEPTGGLIVTFGLGGGSATGAFGPTTDNGNGAYTASFTGALAGSNTITAFISAAPVTSGNPNITVVPGAVSVATSTVAIVPAAIVAGSTASITLTARDAAGNLLPVGGLTVVYALGLGSSGGAIGLVTDNGNGTYTATFFATTAGTPRTIDAFIGGIPVSSALPNIVVSPGAFSLTQSALSLAPGTIQSGGAAIATLTARDAFGNQETSGGLTVGFGLGAGSASGSFSATTDNGNGTYSTVFTGALAGSNTLTASINTLSVASTAPSIVITPGPVSLAKSSVVIAPGSIPSGGSAVVTLTARDAAGNQENSGGLAVSLGLGVGTASGTFSAVTDNGNGTYTATFSGVNSGSNTIQAAINAQSLTSTAPTVFVTPSTVSLAQSTVSLAPASIQSGSSTTITLVARDTAGNQETSGGLAVVFFLGGGSAAGLFSPVIDHGNGVYTGTFTGIATTSNFIATTINGQDITSGNPAIAVTPGPIDLTQSSVAIVPGTIQSGASATVILTARDAAGNQETTGGLAVSFNLGGGSASGSFGTVLDQHNGNYTATFTGLLAGSNTITGLIGAQTLTSAAPSITVTPGAYSLSVSTVVIAPASIQSGSTATVTLIARDAAGNQEPAGGLAVAFGLGVGSSTGTLGAVTDNGNGTYTTTFTGVFAGTPRIVAAAINGSAVISALPGVAVTPGPVSLVNSTVSVAPASVPSGTSSIITLTARDAAGNQEAGGGLSVAFSLGSGSGSGTIGPVTDNGDGTYSAVFTGALNGSRAIVATVNSQILSSAAPFITVTPGAFSLANSALSIAPASIQSGSSATVTLTVRDAAGNQEASGGLGVVFGLGTGSATGAFIGFTDNHNGTYTATFTGILAGTSTLAAAIDGGAITSTLPTITVTPGAVSLSQSSVSAAPSSIPSGSTTVVTLTARDAAGNPEATGGLAVNFGLGVGNATGTFSAVTDNNNGTYSAAFTGILVGANSITASIFAQAVTAAAPIVTVTPGAVSLAQSSVTISPASVQSGATAGATLTARDANGNLETAGGLSVGFGLGAGAATGTFGAVTDNHNGTYSATFTAAGAGANTVTATINGQAITSAAPTVAVTSGPFSLAQSIVTLAPASITTGGASTVTLTARDAAGNQVTSGGLSVAFSLGAGSATGAFTAVADLGHGTYVATFTGILTGTNTVTAKIGGLSVTSTPPTITVTPAAVNLANSIVTITPASIQSGNTATLTLTARDANGNLEAPGGATVVFGVSGSATGSFSPVTDNHDGTYTATFTGLLAGTDAITASYNAQSLTSTLPTITVTPGPVSLSRSIIAVAPGSIQSGSSATVSLVALDANGNLVTSPLNVAFALGGGSATGAIGAVTNHNNGSYSAVFTGVGIGSNDIAATINSLTVTSAAPIINVTAGPLSPTQSIVTITPASIQSGSTTTITLTTRDANGNPETGGAVVAFSLGAGSATGVIGGVTDFGNGIYTAPFTGILVGANTFSATVNGQAITSTAPTITVTPGPLSLSQSTVTVAPASIASGGTALVTLTARDAAGNLESAGGLTASFALLGGAAAGNFSAVTDHGNGVYTAVFTGQTVGSNAIVASLNAQDLSSSAAPITVTPGPVSVSQSTISITPSSIQAGASALISLTARDAGGNQENTGGLLVSFSFGSGTATGSISAVTDVGNGIYTAIFTGLNAGSCVISAVVNGQAIASTLPTVTVIPGPVSVSQSSVTVAPGSIQAGNPTIVTLTARDAEGNRETAGGLGVAFSLGVGAAAGTIGPITDNLDGTYTTTFTGSRVGSNTIIGAIGGLPLTTPAPTITVTPGAPSPSESIVTLAPATIAVGGVTTVTLTTEDAFGNADTSGGATVVFGLGAGTLSGSFGPVTDNGNGTYSAAFTGGTTPGSGLVTATVSGQAVTSTAPTLAVTPGPVSLTQSIVTVAPASILAGGSTTVILTTKDALGNPETTGGLTVTFGLAGGAASGTFSSVIDQGNGVYTATFTAGAAVGSTSVTATIGGLPIVSAAPTVSVNTGPASVSQSVVTVTPASIALGRSTIVILTAEDALGNQEPSGGLTVTFGLGSGAGSGAFGSVTDNFNGTYSAVFTGTLGGANTITASINGQGVTSAAPTIVIMAAPSTTALSVAPLVGAVFSQAVTLTAVVTPSITGFGTPTGVVSFYEDGNFVGSNSVNSSGVATLTTTSIPASTHSLTATYAGEGNFAASNGEIASYTVAAADTSVAVSVAPPSNDVFGQSVTFTATVTDADGGAIVNSGTVRFYAGGVLLGTSGTVTGGVATLVTSAIPEGPVNAIAALYSGAANFNASTGGLSNYAVNPANTTLGIASSAPVTGLGQAVTFTATLTVGSPSAAKVNSGVVNFYDGVLDVAHLLGTSNKVTNGQATFTTGALTRTVHSIIAVYTDTASDFATSESAPITQTVSGADTVAVSAAPSILVFGQPVTYTIAVAGTGGTPSGAVQLRQGAVTLGGPATLVGGKATITLNSAAVQADFALGANPLTVSYAGDGTFAPNSAAFSQQVGAAATTTILSPTAASIYGKAITFTALVSVNSPGAGSLLGGVVVFKIGAGTLGTGTLNAAGIATYTTSATQLAVGNFAITATYGGAATFGGSVSAARTQTVAAAGTTTTVASSAPTGSIYSQNVTFTAAVVSASAVAPVGGTVTFYNGAASAANLLGSAPLAGGVAIFGASSLKVANHTITAVYSGASGFAASTGTVAQNVSAAGTSTSLASSFAGGSSFGQAVSFFASVAIASPGTGTPTGGTVRFYDGTALIGSVALSAAGTATFTTASLAVNPNHSISAVYTGAGNYAGSTSNLLAQAVSTANTSITLTASATSVKTGQAVSFSVSVKAASGGVATGSVTFVIDGGAQSITKTLANGAASLSFAGFASPGPHTVEAFYNPTANFSAGASNTVNLYAQAASTVTLSSSALNTPTGSPVTLTAAVAGVFGVPTGTVSFYDGKTLLGTFTVNASGFVAITLTNLTIGTHSITATYNGDPTYASSTAKPLSQVIGPKPSGRLV